MPTHCNNLSYKELEKVIPIYLKHCTIERGFSPKTVKNKRHCLYRLLRFLRTVRLSLESLKRYTEYIYNKEWSNSSIATELKIIKTFINFLESHKYIEQSWSSEVVLPKVKRRPFNIVPAEVAEKIIVTGSEPGMHDHRFHQKSKSEHRAALRFVLRTGLRMSELLSLKYLDINLKSFTYSVNSKGGNIDVLPFPGDMLWEVSKRKHQERLFKVHPEGMNRTLRRGSHRLDIKPHLTVHTLRHIFCTSLLKKGVSLQIVSRLMRHSNVGITDKTYSHYLLEDLSKGLEKHPLINTHAHK